MCCRIQPDVGAATGLAMSRDGNYCDYYRQRFARCCVFSLGKIAEAGGKAIWREISRVLALEVG